MADYNNYNDDGGRPDSDPDCTNIFVRMINEGEKLKWGDTRAEASFEEDFKQDFKRSHETNGSILHRLAVPPFKQQRLPLLKWLLGKFPGLLVEPADEDDKLPVHKALEKNFNPSFVEAVLDFADEGQARKAFEAQDARNNCLHLAILREFRSTRQLILKCSKKTFIEQNGEGNTPLHLAMMLPVGYKPHVTSESDLKGSQATSPNPELVGAEKGSRKEVKPNSSKSPASSASKEEEVTLEKKDLKEMKDKQATTKREDEQSNSARKATRKPTMNSDINASLQTPTDAQSSIRRREAFYLPDVVDSLITANHDSMIKKNDEGYTPYQCRLRVLTEKFAGLPKPSPQRKKAFAAPGAAEKDKTIADGMKLYALRKMDREAVLKVLYENGEERHIEFDLSSLPRPSISSTYLTRLENHLKFEDSLQYVALPKLKIELAKGSSSTHSNTEATENPATPPSSKEADGLGLTDLTVVFKWLKKNGVKRIIKVIVVDDGEIAHSDQAIEDCLEGIEIDVWDWKKPDICSETIHKAAKNVREVHLYCTGSNTVLRSWSSEQGLAKLPQLERLYVSIRPGLENRHRRSTEADSFKTDLLKNWAKLREEEAKLATKSPTKAPTKLPDIKWFPDDKSKSRASEFPTNAATEQKQLWLQHMDSCAEYLVNIPEGVEKPTKVAVIDDGFDGFQEDYTENVVSGVSFCRYSDTHSLMNAYYVPSGSHGTVMASLICRVCPLVKLYIARLDEFRTSGGKRCITAQSAAEAVRWAIGREVHVISMSWTIESNDPASDITEFKAAIKEAADKGIVLLCAFSDQGNVSASDCYPGAFDQTIMIGAATNRGGPCTWVNEKVVDLLFPGEHIVVEQRPEASSRPVSGSSVSTALAAGMVALLLHLIQLVDPGQHKKLREDMSKSLSRIANGKYIDVQEVFGFDFKSNSDWTKVGKEELKYLMRGFTK